MHRFPPPNHQSKLFATPAARLLYSHFFPAMTSLVFGAFFTIRGMLTFVKIDDLRVRMDPVAYADLRVLFIEALRGYRDLCTGSIFVIVGLVILMRWLVKKQQYEHQ